MTQHVSRLERAKIPNKYLLILAAAQEKEVEKKISRNFRIGIIGKPLP